MMQVWYAECAEVDDIDSKIGQLIIVGFPGTEPTDDSVITICNLLKQKRLGGVILYRYNIISPEQLMRLTTAIYESNPQAFIVVDQEGGRVQRLPAEKGFNGIKFSAHQVAQKYDNQEDVYLYYQQGAKELKKYKININFAPVVDLNNPESPCPVIGKLERSFGNDPDVVSDYARSFIKAHRKEGVLTCLKHFPGHGYAENDSHLPGLVDTTRTAVYEKELAPYINLLNTRHVDMIMTAHIVNINYDPENHPATLSTKMVPDLLRSKGFNGVVVSDDMHMGTIQKNYSFQDSIYRAIAATCDLLVFSNNPLSSQGIENFQPDLKISELIIDNLKQGIKEEKVNPVRIEESYQRVLLLKEQIKSSF